MKRKTREQRVKSENREKGEKKRENRELGETKRERKSNQEEKQNEIKRSRCIQGF